jgi:hypothetical protein
VNQLFEIAGGGLNPYRAEVSRRPLERVSQPFGKSGTAAGQRGADLGDGRTLFLDELAK